MRSSAAGNSRADVLGALACFPPGCCCPAAMEKVKVMVERVRPGHGQEGWWDGCELLGSARHGSDRCKEGLGNRNASFLEEMRKFWLV